MRTKQPTPTNRKAPTMNSARFPALLIFSLFLLTGCQSAQLDWGQACTVLQQADDAAADFQATYAPDSEQHKAIAKGRALGAPLIVATCNIAADPGAPDPTKQINEFMIAAKAILQESITDPKKQATALRYFAGFKLALTLTGVHVR